MNLVTCIAHQTTTTATTTATATTAAAAATTSTTSIAPQPEKACSINHPLDAVDQSSDTASSNGASPITPYDLKPFTFSEYGHKIKIGTALDTETKGSSLHTSKATLDIPPYTYQQPVQQKQDAQQPAAQPLDNDVDTPSPNQTNMPEIVTAGNSNGDSIIPKMPWDNPQNHHDGTSIITDDTIENQGNASLMYGTDEKYDIDSIGNSSCSIACLDFPSPPSSTPSLVPKLTIQTDRQHRQEITETSAIVPHLHHHIEDERQQDTDSKQLTNFGSKSMTSSRFKEIFDIEGTNIEHDYNIKYCQQPLVSATKSYSSPLAPLPEKSVSSFTSPISTKHDGLPFFDKQQTAQPDSSSLRGNTNSNKTIGGFITNIGRSASSSSSSTASSAKTKPDGPTRSLSSSSSSSSLRGLMRSFSTTATNHYRQQAPKMTRQVTEEEGLTRAAQAVAASTTNDDDKLYLRRDETISESTNHDATTSLDGQRRKISQLFSTTIKKAPSRRYTTKIVNMQQQPPSLSSSRSSSSKKLLRRTVIYINPEDGADHHDFYADLLTQYQPQRPAPNPPSQPQRYRYDKTLPPIPPATETTSPSTRSSMSSSSTSSSGSRQKPPSYLQGLELREMEDGSMEWGIIKKEGHRESFFAMDRLPQNDREDVVNTALKIDDGTDEHIEQQVLALMGLEPDHLERKSRNQPPPIPRRSPRRKPSTLLPSVSSTRNINKKCQNSEDSLLLHSPSDTKEEDDETSPASTMNVYYAPDMTLPSLLQLVSQTQQNNNNSNSNSVNNVV